MISFPLLTLGCICYFSSCFSCKVRLFEIFFSCFLRHNCIAINFPSYFIYLLILPPHLFFSFFLLYNIVLVLPYTDMYPQWVYMCYPSWTPLQPPSLSHPPGSSQCASHEHLVSCIKPGLAIHFTYDNLHVSMPFSQFLFPLCACPAVGLLGRMAVLVSVF